MEVKRFDRPEGGWGTVAAIFTGLQGDKTYQISLTFASEAAGHPLLGPMVFSGGLEVVVRPRDPGGLNPRMRTERLDEGEEGRPAWRFAARASGGVHCEWR